MARVVDESPAEMVLGTVFYRWLPVHRLLDACDAVLTRIEDTTLHKLGCLTPYPSKERFHVTESPKGMSCFLPPAGVQGSIYNKDARGSDSLATWMWTSS
jgi:hypothetical protein